MTLVPHAGQETDYSCGAAALLAVLRYWKVDGGDDEAALRGALGTTRAGTTVRAILDLATARGLDVSFRSATLADLQAATQQRCPPILALQAYAEDGKPPQGCEDGHYVVLVSMNGLAACFMDPASDEHTYLLLPELQRRWHDRVHDGECFSRPAIFIRGRAAVPAELPEGAMSMREQKQGLWLYLVRQFVSLRNILRDREIVGLDPNEPVAFSEKPVNAADLRYGEVVLVFAREALARQLELRREGLWAARGDVSVTFDGGDLVRVFVKDERLLPGIRALYPEVPCAVLKLKDGTEGETTELVDAVALSPQERNILAILIDFQRTGDHSKGMPAKEAEASYEVAVLDALHDKGLVEYPEWGGTFYYRALPAGYIAAGRALPGWAGKAAFKPPTQEAVPVTEGAADLIVLTKIINALQDASARCKRRGAGLTQSSSVEAERAALLAGAKLLASLSLALRGDGTGNVARSDIQKMSDAATHLAARLPHLPVKNGEEAGFYDGTNTVLDELKEIIKWAEYAVSAHIHEAAFDNYAYRNSAHLLAAGVTPPEPAVVEAWPEVTWSKLDPKRKGYAKVVSQEKGISDHYVCSICRGGFPLNKAGRLEALACCADAKRPVNEAAFDNYAYRNSSLLDMVRLLALVSGRRPLNMGLVTRLLDRLAAALELATVAVLGRVQAQALSGLLRRALANISDAMQTGGLTENRERLARVEHALSLLEG